MAHRFDSGLSVPIRQSIRDAIADALKPMLRAQGSYVATIVKLPMTSRFSSEADEQMLDELVQGNSPAIGIGLGRQTFSRGSTNGTLWRGDLEISIYVCVKNVRSVLAGLAGDVVSSFNATKDPGVETILEHCLGRISGTQVLAPEGAKITPDTEEPAYVGAEWQVWEQAYRVTTEYKINPSRNVAGTARDVAADHAIDGSPSAPVTTVTPLEVP